MLMLLLSVARDRVNLDSGFLVGAPGCKFTRSVAFWILERDFYFLFLQLRIASQTYCYPILRRMLGVLVLFARAINRFARFHTWLRWGLLSLISASGVLPVRTTRSSSARAEAKLFRLPQATESHQRERRFVGAPCVTH